MSGIADKIKTAQDLDGMLRRAMERIIQLYTDKSHFVYELLQNAEDAEAKSIRFIQYRDRLEVMHDGKPFTSANLQGLCDVGKSDKADNLNQIGEFGVGFKSVFGICETVRLYSNPERFRSKEIGDAVPFAVEITNFTHPEDISPEEIPESFTTRFVFPYAVGKTFSGFDSVDKLNDTLSRKLQNLGVTTLLFMRNLELIEYRIETGKEPIKGEYLLDKQLINDHCMLVSALGSAQKSKREKDDELISYLMFSRRLSKYAQRTVDIAFPVKEENGSYQCIKAPSPYVSVYFPTETESKLDFIVQGPYRTTPNRSSIPADDEDNIYLSEETASLLIDSIIELRDSNMLNMSFVKALPIDEDRFETYGLFYGLFEAVRDLFQTEQVIPTKAGGYARAEYAKIARQEKLTAIFDDEKLSQLINDGHRYAWVPTFITENNREYKSVLDYLNYQLEMEVIRPEDTRPLFAKNPKFLPAQTDDWIVDLYGLFENIPASFSRTRNEVNMLSADIIKTSDGKFVAPYRREGKSYILNVFLPSPKIHSSDISFVDSGIYNRCRHFFDEILQIQRPNEYEFIIRDIKTRYENGQESDEDRHIEDVRFLTKYLKYEEYSEEVKRVIRDLFAIRCKDGKMRNAYSARIFLPRSENGINIEAYYRNVVQTVCFADVDFYSVHDVGIDILAELGVRTSLAVGETETGGMYFIGGRGRQPEWWTSTDFRWKYSLDSLKEVLTYISAHPSANDSLLKSQAIMKSLAANEEKLLGVVHITGSTPNIENEPCELIHILRGDRTRGWDGKWIYTESGELVSPRSISKHDLSCDIYGRIRPDSIIFELLGFKKTEDDEVAELKRSIPVDKLNALFESELRQRYGISSADLNERYGSGGDYSEQEEDNNLPFPALNVKNWDALKKHAAEMLVYADPVRYDYAVRHIRVSNRAKEAKAYLFNMYRYEGTYKYACQLCHETCSTCEVTELFLKPETELDPVNLFLCPNCAAVYRRLRNDLNKMEEVRKAILSKKEIDITSADHVAVSLDDDDELWFTQTHFAEIQELLRLSDEVKNSQNAKHAPGKPLEETEQRGLAVYDGYKGKTIRRKDGFEGKVLGVVDVSGEEYLLVSVAKGKDTGKETKIQLKFVLSKNGVYSIID